MKSGSKGSEVEYKPVYLMFFRDPICRALTSLLNCVHTVGGGEGKEVEISYNLSTPVANNIFEFYVYCCLACLYGFATYLYIPKQPIAWFT